MRFFLEKMPSKFSDGILIKDNSIQIILDNIEVYTYNELYVPLNKVLESSKNGLILTENGYIKFPLNGDRNSFTLPIDVCKIKQDFLSYRNFLSPYWDDMDSFSSLTFNEEKEFIDDLITKQNNYTNTFKDEAYIILPSGQIKFVLNRICSGIKGSFLLPIDIICSDGLLLNGEIPTSEQIDLFKERMDLLRY